MQERHLFEYAVIRIMPRVEREEFINVGVILYCAKEKFLNTALFLDQRRLRALSSDVDIDEIRLHLDSFVKICKGGIDGGPIGFFDLPSRFRWLTATRSTVVQTSKVHPGLCSKADEQLQQLLNLLVK